MQATQLWPVQRAVPGMFTKLAELFMEWSLLNDLVFNEGGSIDWKHVYLEINTTNKDRSDMVTLIRFT